MGIQNHKQIFHMHILILLSKKRHTHTHTHTHKKQKNIKTEINESSIKGYKATSERFLANLLALTHVVISGTTCIIQIDWLVMIVDFFIHFFFTTVVFYFV